MKRICVVTGTRAEFGLLRWVIDGIDRSSLLELQLVATGMHLSPEFGLTVRSIAEEGFKIDRKVEMLLASDTAIGITKSMGLGIIGFADAFSELNPDMVLVLGDRFEIFAAASAAMIAGIPIVHLHGGETTEGAIDEAIRHSITKMAHLHFVATEEYKRRVIQLGEHPNSVHVVGGLGIDSINRQKFLSIEELEQELELKLGSKSLLVTFHPATLERGKSSDQMGELLAALSERKDTTLIFTMPNADVGGRHITEKILDFCNTHPNAKFYKSLGQMRYLSCLNYVDGVVGNSSSGLLEVPSFKKGTINIGDRQKGRLRAFSVIDCEPTLLAIRNAINFLYSDEFQRGLPQTVNPYGIGGASEKIIENIELTNTINLKKTFYDLL